MTSTIRGHLVHWQCGDNTSSSSSTLPFHQRALLSPWAAPPNSLLSQPLATTDVHSDFIDLPLPKVSYKWNHIMCGLLCIQFSSVTQSCPTLCNSMNCNTSGLPVHHKLPESTQTHVHWVGDDIQLYHPLSPPSPPPLNLSQHQGLFQWVNSSHQVAKVLEFQHQSFQWTPRTDLL